MYLHTDCATNMIFHIWWQNFSICMMFVMNLSWTRISNDQSTRWTFLYSLQFLSEGPMPIIFDVTRQPTSSRTLVDGFAYRLCHRYDFPYLMAELFHMYDVWNEPVLEQNISISIQNWPIIWPSYSYDWCSYNFLITRTIAMWYSEV